MTRWCFAALNTLEPPLFQITMIDLFGAADPTGAQRRPELVKWAARALTSLEDWRNAGVLDGFPRVSAYRERCEARPAWRRTMDAYEQRLGAPAGSAR